MSEQELCTQRASFKPSALKVREKMQEEQKSGSYGDANWIELAHECVQ